MYKVDEAKCIGCGKCVKDCFPQDIQMNASKKAVIFNKTCFACGHCIAICPVNAVSCDHLDMSEVIEYNAETFDIEPERLMNFIKFRRTVRHFKDKPLTQEQIMQIIEAGRFTQTGSNLQDVSFTVVQDKLNELKAMTHETLSDFAKVIIKEVADGKREDPGYGPMWLRMHEAFLANPTANDRIFFNAPAIIVVTAETEVNATLASSNMELMIGAMGLGTLFSGFFVRAAKLNPNLAYLIGITDPKKIATCIVVGYPNVSYERTVPRNKPNVTWL